VKVGQSVERRRSSDNATGMEPLWFECRFVYNQQLANSKVQLEGASSAQSYLLVIKMFLLSPLCYSAPFIPMVQTTETRQSHYSR
jgi:hypothetical protein